MISIVSLQFPSVDIKVMVTSVMEKLAPKVYRVYRVNQPLCIA